MERQRMLAAPGPALAQASTDHVAHARVAKRIQRLIRQRCVTSGGSQNDFLGFTVRLARRTHANHAVRRYAEQRGQLSDDRRGEGLQSEFGIEPAGAVDDQFETATALVEAPYLVEGADGRGDRGK